MRKELFDLEYVRISSSAVGFATERYNNSPILFTCDDNERQAFDYLYNQLLYGPNTNIDSNNQLTFILLLNRIANIEEIKKHIKNIDIHFKVWFGLFNI